MENLLAEGLAVYGPLGLFCVYFVWRDSKRDQRDAERDKQQIAAQNAVATANTDIAKALASLKTFIEAKL